MAAVKLHAAVVIEGPVADIVAGLLSEVETLEEARELARRRRTLYPYRGRVWLLFDIAWRHLDTAITLRKIDRLEARETRARSGRVARSGRKTWNEEKIS